MDNITTAETVAAIWFTVLFGACMLAPLFRPGCKSVRRNIDNREELDK
jgi:hypothetical protein